MASLDPVRAAFAFFGAHYANGTTFTQDDLKAVTGWTGQTPRTYITKKWKDFLARQSDGSYRVKLEFLRLSEGQFLQHFSQSTPLFTRYDRVRYESVIQYEFLLPLAREPELRATLDELFYLDSIVNRLRELGASQVERWFPRGSGEVDDTYLARAASHVGDLFGGFSVSHVDGRFRIADLNTRAGAADLMKRYGRYLIDETTAVVRFLIRMPSSASNDFAKPGAVINDDELTSIRQLFMDLFAEGLVRIVKEEDEIWLIEESDYGRKLFVWERKAA